MSKPENYESIVPKILISEEEVVKRLDELARQIEKDYEGKDILALCILKGSIFFTVELTKRINKNIEFEFMEVSSYGSSKTSGEVRITKDLKYSIEGKHVLVIEDILDTGKTLKYLLNYLELKKPASIQLCTLLDKPERRQVEVEAEYVGFKVPDKFIVGYGLDFDQKYRNLPYVGYIE